MSDYENTPAWPWQIGWSFVFGANLILPLLFGWEMTRRGGWIGMGCAIVVWWTLGLLACVCARRLATRLVYGGVLVALFQGCFIPHIIVGTISLGIWSALSGDAVGDHVVMAGARFPEIGGFVVTFLTGGQLLFLALICGGVITSFAGPPQQETPSVTPELEAEARRRFHERNEVAPQPESHVQPGPGPAFQSPDSAG
jgi:hypothetical protein